MTFYTMEQPSASFDPADTMSSSRRVSTVAYGDWQPAPCSAHSVPSRPASVHSWLPENGCQACYYDFCCCFLANLPRKHPGVRYVWT